MRIGYEAIRMFISYPHARFLSTFEGNKLNRGHLRRQSTQGWCHRPQGWRHHPRGVAGSAGQVDTWAPSLRRLTPQVVVQAGRPHCHLSGPAAQERVTTTSKRAHRPTRAQSGARAQNHGVNVQTLPTRRREQMPPPSIPTFPHQKAKKSRYQQHAVSYNPYNPSFPRDKAEKSRSQQHDLSILIVGPNQLKCRLSRTRKPKSCTTSNTQCPITRCVGVRVSHAVTGVRWCERPSGCRFSSWSSSSASRRPARRRR